MTCDGCGTETATTVAVLVGKFGNYGPLCLRQTNRQTATGHAQWSRDRDREDNARDLIQPRDINGIPNKAFIDNYPDESKEMFSSEELKQYG